MQIEWNTNWAPTIVTILGTVGITFLGVLLQRKWAGRSRPRSENIEAVSSSGSTRRFIGVKTYSRRQVESKPNGSQKLSEEIIQFKSSKGIITISAEQIQQILKELEEEH